MNKVEIKGNKNFETIGRIIINLFINLNINYILILLI